MTLFERTGDLASAARTGAAYAATVASEFNAPPDSAVMTRLEALRGSLAQQQDTTVVAQSRFETHNFLTRDRLDVASAGAGVAAGDSALSGDELPGTRRLMASALARPRRRGRRTWLSFGATVALVAALGAGARLTRGKTAIAADARKVLVLPFENRTGIDSLRYVGQAAADWIESELMRSRLVDLVPQSVASLYLVSAKGEPSTDPGDIERIARKLGARFLVEGSEYAERDSLIFRARVVDVEQGTVLFAIGPITAARAELRPALAASGARVIGALASLVDDRLGVWARQSGPPPSLESYQLFAAGRELALHRRTADAITYYRRAYVLDTTWIAPLLATAEAYQGLDSVTRFDSTLQLVEMRRDRLTPLEAARVARDRALLNSDETGWLDGARLLNRLAPRSEFAFPLVADLWCAGRAHEGIQVLRQLDAGARWVQESQNYWTWQARLLHLDGEHEEELRVIRKARAVRPNLVRYVLYEVRALAALGRGRELDSLLEHARAMGPSEAVDPFVINSPFTLSLEAYDELVAHGYGSSDVAKHALTLFDDAYASLSASKREADQAVYAAIGRRQIAGDFAGAERLALAHRSIYGDSISVRENLGIFAARLGRREEALAQTRWLALLPERFDQRSPHMAAAHVFAVLHDTADALTSVRDAAASGAFCRGAISEDLHISPEFIALRGYRPLDRFRGSVD